MGSPSLKALLVKVMLMHDTPYLGGAISGDANRVSLFFRAKKGAGNIPVGGGREAVLKGERLSAIHRPVLEGIGVLPVTGTFHANDTPLPRFGRPTRPGHSGARPGVDGRGDGDWRASGGAARPGSDGSRPRQCRPCRGGNAPAS